MPIAPEPMTTSDFGIEVRLHGFEIGPDQFAIRFDAGSARGRAPVATMMCLAV